MIADTELRTSLAISPYTIRVRGIIVKYECLILELLHELEWSFHGFYIYDINSSSKNNNNVDDRNNNDNNNNNNIKACKLFMLEILIFICLISTYGDKPRHPHCIQSDNHRNMSQGYSNIFSNHRKYQVWKGIRRYLSGNEIFSPKATM